MKKNEDGKFSASLYIIVIYIFTFAPFYGFIIDLFEGIDKSLKKILYAFYLLIIIFLVVKKYYNNKKLEKILKENKNKIYFPIWAYFLIFPVSVILGIGTYILISVNILQKFNLEGYLYKLF